MYRVRGYSGYMRKRHHLIYALIDPRNDAVRYVGKSSSGMQRPAEHWQKSRLEQYRDTHSARWVNQLASLGLVYKTVVLEDHVAPEVLADREIWWIAFARAWGCDLTNVTDGGEGTLGRVRSAEERAKQSATNNTPEMKAKLKALAQARWADPEYRAKHAASLKRPEVVARKRERQKALWAAKHDELAASVRIGCNAPEETERRRAHMQEQNADPAFREASNAGHRTPEALKNMRTAAYKRWEKR